MSEGKAMKIVCETCLYFHALPATDREGQCRRNAPPHDIWDDNGQPSCWSWPKVGTQTDWCGEYKPNPEEVSS
jgi:hypothetical protein